jgi:hypothetical protein
VHGLGNPSYRYPDSCWLCWSIRPLVSNLRGLRALRGSRWCWSTTSPISNSGVLLSPVGNKASRNRADFTHTMMRRRPGVVQSKIWPRHFQSVRAKGPAVRRAQGSALGNDSARAHIRPNGPTIRRMIGPLGRKQRCTRSNSPGRCLGLGVDGIPGYAILGVGKIGWGA